MIKPVWTVTQSDPCLPYHTMQNSFSLTYFQNRSLTQQQSSSLRGNAGGSITVDRDRLLLLPVGPMWSRTVERRAEPCQVRGGPLAKPSWSPAMSACPIKLMDILLDNNISLLFLVYGTKSHHAFVNSVVQRFHMQVGGSFLPASFISWIFLHGGGGMVSRVFFVWSHMNFQMASVPWMEHSIITASPVENI